MISVVPKFFLIGNNFRIVDIIVLPGIEKTALSSFPVTNNCVNIWSYRSPVTHNEVQLDGMTPSWLT
jgi:hypothetical protein